MEKKSKVKLMEDTLQEQPISTTAAPVQASPEEVAQAQDTAVTEDVLSEDIPEEAPEAANVDASPDTENIEPREDTPLFTPPAAGYVPAGWVKIEDLATAVAQATGDVEAAETAPDVQKAATSAPEEDYKANTVNFAEEGQLVQPVQNTEDQIVQESKETSDKLEEATEGEKIYVFYEVWFNMRRFGKRKEDNFFTKKFPGPVEALRFAIAHSCGFKSFEEFQPHMSDYDIPENVDINSKESLIDALYNLDYFSGDPSCPTVFYITEEGTGRKGKDREIYAADEAFIGEELPEYYEEIFGDGHPYYIESKKNHKKALREDIEDEDLEEDSDDDSDDEEGLDEGPFYTFTVYPLDENDDEEDPWDKDFSSWEDAARLIDSLDVKAHIVCEPISPDMDPDMGPDAALRWEYEAPFEAYEIVWTTGDPLPPLKEKKIKRNTENLSTQKILKEDIENDDIPSEGPMEDSDLNTTGTADIEAEEQDLETLEISEEVEGDKAEDSQEVPEEDENLSIDPEETDFVKKITSLTDDIKEDAEDKIDSLDQDFNSAAETLGDTSEFLRSLLDMDSAADELNEDEALSVEDDNEDDLELDSGDMDISEGNEDFEESYDYEVNERIPVKFRRPDRISKEDSSLRKPSLKVKESYEGFLPAGSEHFAEEEDLVRTYEKSAAERRREIVEFRKAATARRKARISERRVGDYYEENNSDLFKEALRGTSKLELDHEEEPTSDSWRSNRLEEKRKDQQWSFKELLAKGWLG